MEFIITVSCLLAAIIFIVKRRNTKITQELQQQGVIYIGTIRNIITCVQQHRGLSVAWLNGDTKASVKLTILKQKISGEMKFLDVTFVSKNERWIAFVDHWRSKCVWYGAVCLC